MGGGKTADVGDPEEDTGFVGSLYHNPSTVLPGARRENVPLHQIVFLVTGLTLFITIRQGLVMAAWHRVFLTLLIILVSLAAGCTDISPVNLPPTLSTPPAPADSVLPGQPLQVFGDVTGEGIPGGTIDNITFTVGLANVHDSVDMEQITIVYADAIRTETLHPVDGYYGDPPKGFWGIIRVENQVGSPNNRLDNMERFVIRINPTAFLVPRQMITIDIKPAEGRSLTIRRVAPPTILADNILSPL
jgi:hypothetical protein